MVAEGSRFGSVCGEAGCKEHSRARGRHVARRARRGGRYSRGQGQGRQQDAMLVAGFKRPPDWKEGRCALCGDGMVMQHCTSGGRRVLEARLDSLLLVRLLPAAPHSEPGPVMRLCLPHTSRNAGSTHRSVCAGGGGGASGLSIVPFTM